MTSFASFPDPMVERIERQRAELIRAQKALEPAAPEMSLPARAAAGVLGGIFSIVFFLLFCTFGLGGIFLVSALFDH